MSIFLCTANGDFAIVGNQMWLTDDSVSAVPVVAVAFPAPGQETLQLIRNNLRMQMGEEILNPSLGVPYLQTIFQKGTPLETVQAILYDTILNTPGVLNITSFTITQNKNTRQTTVTFTAQTATGAVTSTETFP